MQFTAYNASSVYQVYYAEDFSAVEKASDIANLRNLSDTLVYIDGADKHLVVTRDKNNASRCINLNRFVGLETGTFTMEFDAKIKSGAAYSSQLALATTIPGGVSANNAASAYVFALSANTNTTNWTINGTADDAKSVTLNADEVYNYKITITTGDTYTVTAVITAADGTEVYNSALTPTTSAKVLELHVQLGSNYSQPWWIDNCVTYVKN